MAFLAIEYSSTLMSYYRNSLTLVIALKAAVVLATLIKSIVVGLVIVLVLIVLSHSSIPSFQHHCYLAAIAAATHPPYP